MNEPRQMASKTGQYIVRHYDGFDHDWMDVSKPLTWDEAVIVWNKKTKDGTSNTRYADIDYYSIFPSDTKMLYSS
jgi:hypothetical protein